MECSLESCHRNAYTLELCRPHYQHLQRYGDVFADLLLPQPDVPSDHEG